MLTPKVSPPDAPAAPKPASKPRASKDTKKPAGAAAEPGAEVCAWPGCGKAARKNSKYCSRACSNKNARHRHKMRAKKPDTPA